MLLCVRFNKRHFAQILELGGRLELQCKHGVVFLDSLRFRVLMSAVKVAVYCPIEPSVEWVKYSAVALRLTSRDTSLQLAAFRLVLRGASCSLSCHLFRFS